MLLKAPENVLVQNLPGSPDAATASLRERCAFSGTAQARIRTSRPSTGTRGGRESDGKSGAAAPQPLLATIKGGDSLY